MITNKIVAIDFDGTITKESPYPKTGKIRPNCKKAIDYISEKNTVILWTCRTGEDLEEAREFLQTHDINIKILTEINSKLIADIYIDDRNYPLMKIDWFEIEKWFQNEKI